jgi:hypothetical protein
VTETDQAAAFFAAADREDACARLAAHCVSQYIPSSCRIRHVSDAQTGQRTQV